MRTKIINDQLTDLFYYFIEMEDRIAANDRYADLNSSVFVRRRKREPSKDHHPGR